MMIVYYDVKVDDKVVYYNIPEHSLHLWMTKAERLYKKRPYAQARMNIKFVSS